MKKLVERHRLESFLRVAPIGMLPDPIESETPDFLFPLTTGYLGVEITGLVSPRIPHSDNPRQSRRVLDSLLSRIQVNYAVLGGKPAHVSIFFRPGLRVSKNDEERTAREVAAAIIDRMDRNAYRCTPPIELPLRHTAVHAAALWPCPTGEQPRWHYHTGGAVDTVREIDIAATLAGKEPKLAAYRKRADVVWLVIVCDLFSEGLMIDVPTEPIDFSVESGFDRIFCLAWTGAHVAEVPVRRQQDDEGTPKSA